MRGKRSFCMSLRRGTISLAILFLISLWLGMNSGLDAQPFAYIPNFDDGTVSVINTETDTVTSTVPVAVEPTSVAAHPDGNRVYVTHGEAGGNIISLIDPFSNTMVSIFSSGGMNPVGAAIHPDGTRLYVTNSGNGVLTVIDTATQQVAATVQGMNSPLGVAVHPDGTRVYVANNGIGQPVSVIDAATNTVIATVGMGNPSLLSILPNGSKLYVSNTNDGQVSVIDTASNTVRATINVGIEPYGVASHPDGTTVYVANLGDNTVSVIDTTTDMVIATIPVSGKPCHVALHPDGTRVYIAHDLSTGNNISVINTTTNTVVGTIKAGSGPQGLAFSTPNEIIKLLKSAGPDYWAVLALGGSGTNLSMSGSASVVGTVADVGVAKTGNVSMSGSSTIQGTLFLNMGGALNESGSATISGGVRKDAATDGVLDQGVADAHAASQTVASLSPTFTSITNINITNPSQNITVSGGMKTNVLKLTNMVISNGTLTLSAPRGGQFLINVSGNFNMSGGSKIALAGGLTPYDVLYNVAGAGQVALSGGSTVSGIILAPARRISLNSSFITGAVIAGGSQIANSGGQINNLEQFKATISAVPILGSAPLQVQFNAVVGGGVPPYTYAWELDGNGTTDDTRQGFVYTYQQPGIYHVTLRVNDAKENQVSATAVVNATVPNRNPIANPGGPYSGLINVPVQFNGSGSNDPDGDPITYNWDFGDGATGSGVNPVHAYANAGPYTVTLTVFDNRGGSGTARTTTQINNPAPSLSSIDPSSIAAGGPDFTLTLNGDNFIRTSIVSFNNQQYAATFIRKNQITATIPAIAITTPGSRSVKVINPTPGGGESFPLMFTVTQGFQITGFSPTEGPVGTAVTINGLGFDTGNLRVSFNGTPAVVSSFTKTSITTTVPMGATTGPIAVTTSLGTATSASAFTVTSLYHFSISIAPQSIKAAPNSRVSYVISATGSGNFSNLITLSIQGLPDGFTALFSPKTITKGQSANLTITTCDCTLSSPAVLTIAGSSVIDGKTVTQSVGASLEMTAQGETTLTGLILDTDNRPIKGVVIWVGSSSATTNESGNFVLENPPTGQQVVLMDGFPASTETAHYPTIPITMNIVAGQTNSLSYVPHFHAQKNSNFTPIDPAQDTIAEDPEIPGFQLRIPAGVDIIGWDGDPNTKVSIRKVPIDALPVPPPPREVQVKTVYMFYFGKMGGGVPTTPIPVTVPNDLGLEPGEKANLWYYNESPNLGEAPNEWDIAGTGTVSEDGATISTDPGVGIPRFCCGAIVWAPTYQTGPNIPTDPCKIGSGGSVEPSTGVFTHSETDLTMPGRIPITITRYYRNLDSFHGPYGIGTYFSYDWYLLPSGGMAVLTIPPGTRISFIRQTNGTYINNSEPTYRGAVVTFNSDGTKTLRMKDGVTFKFDGYGLLIEQSDRNGNRLRFLREVEGNVTKIVDANGRIMVTFSISILGRDVITQMSDLTGRKVIYAYDTSVDPGTGRLMSVTNPEGGVTRYTYDTKGRMTSIIDSLGNTALNVSYDVNGRVCQEQYAEGGTNKFYYITVAQSTTPAAMRLLSEATSGGPISTPLCSAVASNSPVAYTIIVDPNENPRVYRFNGAQKIISSTDANGQSNITETDPVTNLVKSRTDALGRKTSYAYDNNGNVTSVTDPVGNTTTMVYDQTLNKPIKITDAMSNVTNMTYDTNGNLISTQDPLGNTTTVTYNQYGQPVSVTDPLGNITTSEHDAYGNLVKTTDPLGNSATMQYDALSRLIQSTDARGRTTTYAYDLMNRLIQAKDAANGITKSTYDLNGNLLSITDAKEQTTSYTYNAKNRLTSMKDQLGRTETYEYDINGNLKSKTDRKAQITTYSYDNNNRVKRVDYADGSYTENTFDAVGRLTSVSDSISGSIQYVYSDMGCSTCGGVADKVIQEKTPLGSISYTYDAIGRRTTMTVAGQPTVNYQYDLDNRLLGISTLNSQLGTLNFNMAYDGLGRRTSLTYPNGVTTNYQYDNASRLLNIEHLNPMNQILESLDYMYDENGSRTNMQRGNVPVNLPDLKANITFNSANQMLTFNDNSMTYDENGNLSSVSKSCGTTTYTRDARNQLVAINGFTSALASTQTCETLTASFKYDAFGRRIEKTINGMTIQYFYSGMDIVQEIENGVISANYVPTLNIDQTLARVTPNSSRFYQTDALGSVIALTDETGSIKTEYIYDPFGNVSVSGESSGNPFQYTGRENDGTGLYYYRARYYSPLMQRFISEDPIGFFGGINLYRYVQNNPVRYIDPFGLDYADLNFSYGFIIPIFGIPIPVGITGGIMVDDRGNIFPYLGGGLMNPGFGFSLMKPKDPCDQPATGLTLTAQGGYGLVGQAGYNFSSGQGFTEWGAGTPGLGLTGYYVFQPIHIGR